MATAQEKCGCFFGNVLPQIQICPGKKETFSRDFACEKKNAHLPGAAIFFPADFRQRRSKASEARKNIEKNGIIIEYYQLHYKLFTEVAMGGRAEKEKSEKTNAMRELEAAGIAYEGFDYPEDAEDGMAVAEFLGQDPFSVFKTLVTRSDKGEFFVFEVPVNSTLDLKKAARAAGAKSVEMIKQKELLPLTGYIHGGCSPVGMKKRFPTFIDETAVLFDTIFVSSGKRGKQIRISPYSLAEFIGAAFVPLTVD